MSREEEISYLKGQAEAIKGGWSGLKTG